MKKLILLLLLFLSLCVRAQTPVSPVQLTTNTAYLEPSTGLHWYYNGTTYQWWAALGIKDSTRYVTPYYLSHNYAPIGSGVTSFNGRTGVVVPLNGDYSSFYPSLSGSYVNPSWIVSLPYSKITGTPSLAGFVTYTNATADLDLVTTHRYLYAEGAEIGHGSSTGAGLSAILAYNNNSTGVGVQIQAGDATHESLYIQPYNLGAKTIQLFGDGHAVFAGTITASLNGNASTVTNGVYTSRNISTGYGLLGGGNLGSNLTLSADTASSLVNKNYYNTVIGTATQTSLAARQTYKDALTLSSPIYQIYHPTYTPLFGYGSLVYFGNSLQEGYGTTPTTTAVNSYPNRMDSIFRSYGIVDNSKIAITNFSDPTRYSISISGTTSITATGPIGKALTMTPGSVITFTGAYDFVDVWFKQASGAGTLTFARNGTPYRTVNANGATANVSTFANVAYPPTTTPSGASATYTITCSGANVTITKLYQLVATAGAKIYQERDAMAGYSTKSVLPYLSDIKQMNLGNSVTFLVDLVTNDIYNPTAGVYQTPAQTKANIIAIHSGIADSLHRIVMVMPSQANTLIFTPVVAPYKDYVSVVRSVCDSLAIQLIDMSNFDFNDLNYLNSSDGLHYNNEGAKAMAIAAIQQFAYPRQNGQPRKAGTTSIDYAAGNDPRILNGQTAYSWGNPSGVYLPINDPSHTGVLSGPWGFLRTYTGGGASALYPAGVTPSNSNFTTLFNPSLYSHNASTDGYMAIGGSSIVHVNATGADVTGALKLNTTPGTSSIGTYSILSYNNFTGTVEKLIGTSVSNRTYGTSPPAATDTGIQGQEYFDTSTKILYVCYGTNLWTRYLPDPTF